MHRPDPSTQRDFGQRDFGRDGISGLVTRGRALRAREVSTPTPADMAEAERTAEQLLAKLDQQRQRRRRR